jgi:hypothetical protein
LTRFARQGHGNNGPDQVKVSRWRRAVDSEGADAVRESVTAVAVVGTDGREGDLPAMSNLEFTVLLLGLFILVERLSVTTIGELIAGSVGAARGS